MTTQLLKGALGKALEGCTVQAALFTSFNFEPRFFENYVMPLLVPSESFGQDELFNNIRWRWLYAQSKVPNVAVYVDQYAKSGADAPLLDYTVHSISMPGKGRVRGAFHPKVSLILANHEKEERLILLCGSGNLTEGGWCKNAEAFTMLTLIPNVYFPRNLREELVSFLGHAAALRKATEDTSIAEERIRAFLNKRGRTEETTCSLYHSGNGSLATVLEEHVNSAPVERIEVISPYCEPSDSEIKKLLTFCSDVRIQVPMMGGCCALAEMVYDTYENAGAVWYEPPPQIDRWCHAKAYRFFMAGSNQTHTVIGSVNLTKPGWSGLKGAPVYNMEAALLLKEKIKEPEYLLTQRAQKSTLTFRPELADSDEAEIASVQRYETPDILFTIDWTNGELFWRSRSLRNPCLLQLPGRTVEITQRGALLLRSNSEGRALLKAIAKNCLLRVEEQRDGTTVEHYYYPLQKGFQQKPFPINYSAADILKLWDQLGNADAFTDEAIAKFLERLTEHIVDASGAILRDNYVSSSLLNEQARYFSSLIRLERYLYKPDYDKLAQYKQEDARREILYYLSADNINTLPALLTDLEGQHEEGSIQNGFLLILLSMLKQRFYDPRRLKRYLTKEVYADHKKSLTAIVERMEVLYRLVVGRSGMSAEKIKWFENELVL